MKKIRTLALLAVVTFGLSSCVVYESHSVTGNPIGTKVGVAKSKAFGNSDVSMRTAAKNGKIDKIGSVETRTTIFIIPFIKTTVTGE